MPQEGLKRKLAAILSADVTEYGRLMREDETATIRTLTTYREVMSGLIKQHHGRVVDAVGDNLLAEFSSVVEAVQGAIAIQKELKSRNAQEPESRRMLFRIGINLGDLVVDGDRIYRDGVNIAARLEALADPGGICISRTAHDQIEEKLPLGYEYLGEKSVKNAAKPVRAYKVLFDDDEEAPRRAKPERKARIKIGEADRTSREEGKEVSARFKFWDRSLFHKILLVYAGVVGLLLIVNLLTWGSGIWFHWPALGWGLLLYLYWTSIRQEKAVGDKNRPKRWWSKHLLMYMGVISFLFIVNILTWSGIIWCHWPALGWGFLVFLHWIKVTNRSPKKKP